jgi:hypothetical protein
LAEASRESVRSATQAAKSFITLTRKSAEQPAPRTISAPVCSPTPPATPATPQQPGGNSNDNSSAGANSSNANSSATAAAAAAAGSSTGSSNSLGSSSGGSVAWHVSVGVQWTGSHYAQAMVTERTVKSTAASQQALLASAQQWLQQPSERRTLGEVMPGAFATQHTGTCGCGDSARASMRLFLCACVRLEREHINHNKNLEAQRQGQHCLQGQAGRCLVVQHRAAAMVLFQSRAHGCRKAALDSWPVSHARRLSCACQGWRNAQLLTLGQIPPAKGPTVLQYKQHHASALHIYHLTLLLQGTRRPAHHCRLRCRIALAPARSMSGHSAASRHGTAPNVCMLDWCSAQLLTSKQIYFLLLTDHTATTHLSCTCATSPSFRRCDRGEAARTPSPLEPQECTGTSTQEPLTGTCIWLRRQQQHATEAQPCSPAWG